MEDFLSEMDFDSEQIAGLSAKGAPLPERTFEACVFENCDLREVDFSRGRFFDCKFIDCDLSNAKLARASLRGNQFERCKLLGIAWSAAENLIDSKFFHCELRYGSFTGMKMGPTQFLQCSLKETDFTHAELAGSSFSGSDCAGAIFQQTNLQRCDFRHALHYEIDPTSNLLKDAAFSYPEVLSLLAKFRIKIL
jgi:fluoroquinolone resistance protein